MDYTDEMLKEYADYLGAELVTKGRKVAFSKKENGETVMLTDYMSKNELGYWFGDYINEERRKNIDNAINKFAEHYKNVDRRYGETPAYKFNDNVYLLGKEMQVLVDKFDVWCDNKYGMKLHHFTGKTESGVEYMNLHISWIDDIKKVLPKLWFISSEEVHYGAFTNK